MKTHYAGAIQDHNGSMLAGWAACCSGDRAISIREKRRNTYRRELVTCAKCLQRIKSHDAYAAQWKRESQRVVDFARQLPSDQSAQQMTDFANETKVIAR